VLPEQEAAAGGVDDWREYSARYVGIQGTRRRRCAVIGDPERTLCSPRYDEEGRYRTSSRPQERIMGRTNEPTSRSPVSTSVRQSVRHCVLRLAGASFPARDGGISR
jgi:hypothetical protein